MSKSAKFIHFLKATALGGLFFLLPLIVIGALIGQAVPIVLTIAEVLGEVIPVRTPGGIALLIVLAFVILVFVCFGAGLLAERSLAKRMSETFEKNLLLLFPRYAVFKEQLAGSIGGDATAPRMKPVLARFDDNLRIGFEIERTATGLVTVYLPGAPDPWSGRVMFLDADRVEPMQGDFGMIVSTFEKLGRDSAAVASGQSPTYGRRNLTPFD
jgi:uncharacterized membrane protein